MTRRELFGKLKQLAPYFAGTRLAFVLGGVGAAIAGVCESGVAWLMVPLVNGNSKPISVPAVSWLPHIEHPPLWMIPVALVVLFAIRGVAGFIVDYSLAWAANQATLRLRTQLFARL